MVLGGTSAVVGETSAADAAPLRLVIHPGPPRLHGMISRSKLVRQVGGSASQGPAGGLPVLHWPALVQLRAEAREPFSIGL